MACYTASFGDWHVKQVIFPLTWIGTFEPHLLTLPLHEPNPASFPKDLTSPSASGRKSVDPVESLK